MSRFDWCISSIKLDLAELQTKSALSNFWFSQTLCAATKSEVSDPACCAVFGRMTPDCSCWAFLNCVVSNGPQIEAQIANTLLPQIANILLVVSDPACCAVFGRLTPAHRPKPYTLAQLVSPPHHIKTN